MGSLFDSDPEVIAKMAFLLDKEEKPGKRNWKHLADMFGVPRSESENFGESIEENPTQQLFEWLHVKRPCLTIGEVKEHLKILKMPDVLEVLAESKEGWFFVLLPPQGFGPEATRGGINRTPPPPPRIKNVKYCCSIGSVRIEPDLKKLGAHGGPG